MHLARSRHAECVYIQVYAERVDGDASVDGATASGTRGLSKSLFYPRLYAFSSLLSGKNDFAMLLG